MIKSIIFFNYGNSDDVSNWANVPFCFTKALEQRGIIIHRVDINPTRKQWRWYGRFEKYICKSFPCLSFGYMQSPIFAIINYYKIFKAVRIFKNADFCFFTNFDYCNCFSKIPTLLFCDWTLKIFVEERQNRKPTWNEKIFYLQQDLAIKNSEYVFSLFPVCAEKMQRQYPQSNINYLGINVINNLYNEVPDKSLIPTKKEKLKILFIGRVHYIQAAIKLIEAFHHITEKYKDAELNIIGLTTTDIAVEWNKNIHCYGFLHKDIKEERDIYYGLLKKSTLICNPSEKWAGYSSMVEAMYFYTPVVVTPYEDFTKEFGYDIKFGKFISNNTPISIAKLIVDIYNSQDYAEMCINANEVVKSYTCDNYVDKLLNNINMKDLSGNAEKKDKLGYKDKNMYEPLVSVIIPNYCHSQYLDLRINTVLCQTYKSFEVIILDDASPDDGASKAIIEKYRENPHVSHIVYNDKNSGSTFIQWHKGFDLAKGELIWIAESDDYCEPKFLEKLVPCFNDHPDCCVAQSARYLVNEHGEELPWFRSDHNGSTQYSVGKEFIKYNMVCSGTAIPNASGVIFRKDIAMSLSKEYMNYKAAGDRLFWILMLEHGGICNVDIQLNYFRFHTNKVTSAKEVDGTQCIENFRINQYLHKEGLVPVLMKAQEFIFYWEHIRDFTLFSEETRNRLKLLWFPHWWQRALGYYFAKTFKNIYLILFRFKKSTQQFIETRI